MKLLQKMKGDAQQLPPLAPKRGIVLAGLGGVIAMSLLGLLHNSTREARYPKYWLGSRLEPLFRLSLWKTILATIAICAALYVGITSYARPIHTIPECALENHHGMGNCPVQILCRYPYLEEELRNRKASHISSWPIRPERVKLDRPKQPRP
jgi:hypothetical protein